VYEFTMRTQKLRGKHQVLGLAYALFIPSRVVEHNECSRVRGEHRQHGCRGETLHIRENRARGPLVNVMNAEMEECRPIWHRPFNRHRHMAAFAKHRQFQRRFNVIVIGERNQCRQAKMLLNLISFNQPSLVWSQRWRPPDPRKIEPPAVLGTNPLVPSEKAQRLSRVQRMAMQRYAG
jgi:hypothetical protein